jgi:hypothetical protein
MIKIWNQKNMKDCDKRKSHISSKLHMTCLSSNNFRQPVTKTFTTLHYSSPNYTSLHLSILHFLSFKLLPTTLHSTSLHLSILHFLSFKLLPTTLHFTQLHFLTSWKTFRPICIPISSQ